MTLDQIIVAALEQLERSNDAQTQGTWSDKFTQLANEGLIDLAQALKMWRTDAATVGADGELSIEGLPYECIKVIDVRQDGKSVGFSRGKTTFTLSVPVTGAVDVEYRYIPKALSSGTDEPGIPERLHSLLVTYVCAREFTTNDEQTQRRSNIFYELYQTAKMQAQKTYGEPETYAIVNKWE